jgi:hypothetical protein
VSQQKPRDLFEELWQYQQGALFLKAENSSLEWKKSLADFFYRKGYESVLERIKELESNNRHLELKQKEFWQETVYQRDSIENMQKVNARLREALQFYASLDWKENTEAWQSVAKNALAEKAEVQND